MNGKQVIFEVEDNQSEQKIMHKPVSAAIKSNILTYEKNLGGGNYSYYYINRDISNEMHQVTAKNSFPTP